MTKRSAHLIALFGIMGALGACVSQNTLDAEIDAKCGHLAASEYPRCVRSVQTAYMENRQIEQNAAAIRQQICERQTAIDAARGFRTRHIDDCSDPLQGEY